MLDGLSVSDRERLAREIRQATLALAARSISTMYADPFWDARFGPRGRHFADEDGQHHVRYLAEAVEIGRSTPLELYSRWLQTLLTARGMCSLHIADNFDRLLDALGHLLPQAVDAAAPLLQAGRRALVYEDPVAGAVLREAMDGPRPDVAVPYLQDEAFPLAYLADALGTGRDGVLLDHLTWVAAEAARHGAAATAQWELSLDRARRRSAAVAGPEGEARIAALWNAAMAPGAHRPER